MGKLKRVLYVLELEIISPINKPKKSGEYIRYNRMAPSIRGRYLVATKRTFPTFQRVGQMNSISCPRVNKMSYNCVIDERYLSIHCLKPMPYQHRTASHWNPCTSR
jgi:hypothetical protein